MCKTKNDANENMYYLLKNKKIFIMVFYMDDFIIIKNHIEKIC
jgi:hypothetical protein